MTQETSYIVLVGSALPKGEHKGPVLAGKQDGETVCQCLTCGKCWTASGRILQDGPVPCRDEEEEP